jgi:hypothetical protein
MVRMCTKLQKVMPDLEVENILLVQEIAERWRCDYTTALRRLRKHKAKVLRFNRNAIRVRLEEVLRIEQECSEIL